MFERMADSFFGFILALLLTGVCFASGVVLIMLTYNYMIVKPSCFSYGGISNQPVFWSMGTGCIVKYDGEWVDFDVATKKKQEVVIRQK